MSNFVLQKGIHKRSSTINLWYNIKENIFYTIRPPYHHASAVYMTPDLFGVSKEELEKYNSSKLDNELDSDKFVVSNWPLISEIMKKGIWCRIKLMSVGSGTWSINVQGPNDLNSIRKMIKILCKDFMIRLGYIESYGRNYIEIKTQSQLLTWVKTGNLKSPIYEASSSRKRLEMDQYCREDINEGDFTHGYKTIKFWINKQTNRVISIRNGFHHFNAVVFHSELFGIPDNIIDDFVEEKRKNKRFESMSRTGILESIVWDRKIMDYVFKNGWVRCLIEITRNKQHFLMNGNVDKKDIKSILKYLLKTYPSMHPIKLLVDTDQLQDNGAYLTLSSNEQIKNWLKHGGINVSAMSQFRESREINPPNYRVGDEGRSCGNCKNYCSIKGFCKKYNSISVAGNHICDSFTRGDPLEPLSEGASHNSDIIKVGLMNLEIHENPTKTKTIGLLNKSRYKELKFFASKDRKNIYVFDGSYHNHTQVTDAYEEYLKKEGIRSTTFPYEFCGYIYKDPDYTFLFQPQDAEGFEKLLVSKTFNRLGFNIKKDNSINTDYICESLLLSEAKTYTLKDMFGANLRVWVNPRRNELANIMGARKEFKFVLSRDGKNLIVFDGWHVLHDEFIKLFKKNIEKPELSYDLTGYVGIFNGKFQFSSNNKHYFEKHASTLEKYGYHLSQEEKTNIWNEKEKH